MALQCCLLSRVQPAMILPNFHTLPLLLLMPWPNIFGTQLDYIAMHAWYKLLTELCAQHGWPVVTCHVLGRAVRRSGDQPTPGGPTRMTHIFARRTSETPHNAVGTCYATKQTRCIQYFKTPRRNTIFKGKTKSQLLHEKHITAVDKNVATFCEKARFNEGQWGESSPLPIQKYQLSRVASIRRNVTSIYRLKWCGAAHVGKTHHPYRTIYHVLMETASQSTLSTYPNLLSGHPRCSWAADKERVMPK